MIFAAYLLTIFFLFFQFRSFDFYTVALASCLIYFIPSLSGTIWYHVYGEEVRLEISDNVILAHTFVILVVLCSAAMHDRWSKYAGVKETKSKSELGISLYLISLVVFVLFLILDMERIVSAEKSEFGRIYSLFGILTPVSIAVFAHRRRWILAAPFFLAAAVDIFAGNREIVAFSLVAFLMLEIGEYGPVRLISYWRRILLGAGGLTFLLVYKNVSAAIVLGRWDLVTIRLFSWEYWATSFTKSEPFITQSILHYSFTQNWSYDGPYWTSILSSLVPIGDLLFGSPTNISSYINGNLFEDVGYGVASNIWAEAFIYGGWQYFVLNSIVFAIMPAIMNFVMSRQRDAVLRAFIAVMGIILLFFIQRSGLVYALVLFKRTLILCISVWIFSRFLRFVRNVS